MDDNQKWLEAAAAIEKDITYLKAAMADAQRNGIPLCLEQEILQLNVVLGIYRTNSANGVVFPHPDNLFCISDLPYDAVETSEAPRGLKASAF
jgi:hypothetical protein